jgi:uncharacterized protein YegP (UPF0339 family)
VPRVRAARAALRELQVVQARQEPQVHQQRRLRPLNDTVHSKEDVMAGYFKIETRQDGQFMFNLKTGADVILTSEAYTTRAACVNGIESVKKNASDDGRYRRTTTPDGMFRFALDAANGQAIGGSGYYETEAARDAAIEAVKKSAPDAEIED